MKYRFTFIKTGLLRFISHLDVNRTMMRALSVSGIPVTYSQGFNPRPLLTFSLPLSLGIESVCETMDVTTDGEFDCSEAIAKMNALLPAQMKITGCAEAKTDPKHIRAATYRIRYENVAKADFESFMAQDAIVVNKRTKTGSKDIDIKPFADICGIEQDGNSLTITVRLPSGSSENINPTLLSEAFSKFSTVKNVSDITRIEVLLSDGSRFE